MAMLVLVMSPDNPQLQSDRAGRMYSFRGWEVKLLEKPASEL